MTSTETPKRTYVRRLDAARDWLPSWGPTPFTITQMANALGWPTGIAAKALRSLHKAGEIESMGSGVYATMGAGQKLPKAQKAPKPPAPPADPYAVMDAVLTELFPGGVKVAHLQQIIEWREATKALLELMEK